MNRLKYVLGIQVPRPIPSNTTFLKTPSKRAIKRHKSEVSLPKPTELLIPKPTETIEFRDYHCAGQVVNGDELMQQQECVQKHRNFSNQLKGSHSAKRYSARNIVNSEKETRNVKPELSIEKDSRSYAQMIQCYSDSLCASNPMAVPKDNLNSTMVNRIHRSPFSTVSAASEKSKNKSKGSKSGNICGSAANTFSQAAKYSSEASTVRCRHRHDDKDLHDSIGETALEKPCLSYAKIIEKYSNSMSLDIDRYNRTGSLIPKRNVSTKLHKVQPILMDTKDVTANSFPPRVTAGSNSGTLDETKRGKAEAKSKEGWATKLDDVINDLKEDTTKTDPAELKSNDKLMLQSVNEPAYWLDRVVNAHKNSIPDKQWVSENTPPDSTKLDEGLQPLELMSDNNAQDVTLQTNKHHAHARQLPPVVASKKPTNPMAEYIKRGPSRSSTLSQSSTQSPATAETKSAHQPQIELRMTPSQNESVVSINVDEPAARSASAANRDHLSVVISSKRNAAGNLNPQTDYGTMRVSISENTIPVKQIEFSINGKPVSELKSIVARADKLDVFSSMDKVEIRIPPKADAAVSDERVGNVVSTSAKSTPVLNLQIAAKFNEPRFQQPKSAESKIDTPQVPTTPPTSAPYSPPTPSAPPKPSLPPKPSRPQNLFNPNTTNSLRLTKGESNKSETTKVAKNVDTTNVINSPGYKNLIRTENDGTVPVDHSQVPVKKEDVKYVTSAALPSNESDKAAIQRSSETAPSKSSPSDPSITDNQTSNSSKATKYNRRASKIIPWWAAENSFTKIRKENEDSNIPPSFEDVLHPRKDGIGQAQNYGQRANPDVASKGKEHVIDGKKIDTASDSKINVSGKKPLAKEGAESTETAETLASIVQVRSPQRWIPRKSKPGVTKVTKYSKPRNVVSNRTVRRAKYRVKGSPYSSTSVKKDLEASTVSLVPSPKVIKYISVTPQKANVAKNLEIKASTENIEQKTNVSKYGGKPRKENSMAEKSVAVEGADTQASNENAQQSSTMLGGKTNLGQRVPPKSNPSATEVDCGANRKETQSRSEKSRERKLTGRHVDEDRPIEEILKSMKPIEKKKDGTLIDYGVVVPSRKPLGNIRQIPRIPNKTPINDTTKETVARQGKIVEPVDVSCTKKQDLSEPKKVLDQTKIVLSKKISSERRPSSAASSVYKLEMTKVSDAALREPPAKTVVENKEQKSVTTLKKDNVDVRQVSKPAEQKPAVKNVTETKGGKPAVTAKKDDSKVEKVIANVFNVKQVPDSPDKKPISSSPTGTVTGKLPFEGTVPDPRKITMNNKTESVRPQSTVASNTWRPFETREQKDGSKPKEQRKAPFEGTVISPSKIVDKAPKKVNSCSILGTDFGSPKANSKSTKSNNPSGNKPKGNTMMPLEGTINPPPDKQNKIGSSVNTRKVTTELDHPSRRDLSAPNTSKTSTDKGNAKAGSTDIVTSSSLKFKTSDSRIATTYCKGGLINNNKKEGKCDDDSRCIRPSTSPYMLFVSEPERPEKNMLYSSWLQRFKDRFGDNKII